MLQKKERSLAPYTQPKGCPKGRPRTTRISGRLEGRLHGGGLSGPPATVRRCRCGLRREEGHKGTTRGPEVIITSLHNYLIKTYSVNHPGITTRFGGREIGLLD